MVAAVTISEAKTKLIKEIAEADGFKNSSFSVRPAENKGEGYLGIIKHIHIYEKDLPNRSLHVVIKCAPSSRKLRECNPIRRYFQREIYMYKVVFPEFEKFQEARRLKRPFSQHPKCFGTLSEEFQECLVFEDLKERSYQLWDRFEPMNSDHVAITVQAYARFHATSLAMKTFQPEVFKGLEKNLQNVMDEETIKKSQASVLASTKNGFKAVEGDERATKALAEYFKELEPLFEEYAKVDKYSVVNHGDCWTNNMMYQYEDRADGLKPTNVCLLDWQISKIGSPILDLAYFILACSSKEVLYDYEKYLDIYYKTLSNFLKEAGCDPSEVFPREEMNKQWKRLAKIGVFVSILVIKLMVSDVDKSVDFTAAAESGKDFITAISDSQSNLDIYYTRLSTLINFMIDKELM